MDMPPSGWYPDPYGAPALLRWWDGAAWTDHTHAETGTAHSGAPQPGHYAPLTRAEPGMALTVLEPPTGPRTEPQPAVPAGQDGNHTAVLSVDPAAWGDGSAWGSVPGGGYRAPRGFLSDPRHHRTIVTAGLAAGVVAAAVIIVSVVVGMRSSSAGPAPVASPVDSSAPASASSAPASPSASPSPSLALLADSASGLSYGQLPVPWSGTCPASVNSTPQVFTWSAGESTTAGQVSPPGSPPVTWYGEACSGQLPAQYGYQTTADLANVTNALANAFNAAYYTALPHSFQPGASQPVSVSGHPGWEIRFTETYTSPEPGMTWSSEAAAVVVTDPQDGAAPAVFYASVPSNLDESNVDTLLSSLTLGPPSDAPAVSPGAPAP
ncbi:MAG: DUF2510 domain-containing protein, partial [Streptosporangiales bacterium]|nr:DUF2510 domain-containing protein [Streptosporangiales bacterium]